MKLLINLILIISLILNYSSAVINSAVGVVEGFYWSENDSINGQYGEYSFTQRKQLITLMASQNLGVYWYVPQLVDTMSLWDSSKLSEWTQVASLGSSLGVKIVVGIRPGWLETSAFPTILSRLQQIQSTGVQYYSLNFDDAEGVATTAQQQLEVQLVNYLRTNLPTMTLYAMIPYAYYQDMFTSKSIWQTKLATIDAVPSNISFVFTGKEITPSTFSSSQFPTLSSNRNLKFFDNWIAGDTSDRISWGMIDGRVNANIFTSSYGYILNLCFPLERIVQHIYCAGQLASGATTCNVGTTAQFWASWLNTNGFLHGKTVSTVKTSLQNAINQDQYFDTMADFEAAYPNLAGIFTSPPSI